MKKNKKEILKKITKTEVFENIKKAIFLGVIISYILYYTGNKNSLDIKSIIKLQAFIYCLDVFIEYNIKYIIAIYSTIKESLYIDKE